ncbi:MAG: type IV toxin-antitoxin system AbiEi family antitoxin domain-containing protein [Deltaproteobacteria bacterium]|nr:type IV toxin-antitoxin system AbiEi family antitoxin domain-containing protein [Deltaproteobacteria bacterium]
MSKIQKLLDKTPEKALITAYYLRQKEVSRQLAQSYVDSGWLERIHNGVYKRKNVELSWYGAVYSLQRQLNLPVHVSGESALKIHNIFHHVTMDQINEPIFLEGPPKTQIPHWFERLFLKRVYYRRSSVLPANIGIDSMMIPDGFKIDVSSPERALLEVLIQVTDDHRFDDASNLTDSFRTWNFDLLLELLQSCKSYKAKRLLMFFGYFHNIEPLMHLADQIDLGKGKIQVVTRGKYNAKYQITVPHSYVKDSEENPF